MEWLQNIFNTIFSMLPDSPFREFLILDSSLSKYVSYLNWLIPFDVFVKVGLAWLSCIIAYYTFILLKKFIEMVIEILPF